MADQSPDESDSISKSVPDARLAAEDNLPSVEPPGASFIVQLFLIPMLIVGIIVAVWLMFSWLAHMGGNPEELIRDFEAINRSSWQQPLNNSTWQKALTLANMLRDSGNKDVRHDAALAQRLAAVLKKQIEDGRMDENYVRFRSYLCRALGEFEVIEVVPALLLAARTEREIEELDVRNASLEALAILTEKIGPKELTDNDKLLPLLREIANEKGGRTEQRIVRGQLRSRAAFVLGLLESPAASEVLESLLTDANPFVRYNAAAGLARQGDVRAVERLQEMLQPNIAELREYAPDDNYLQWTRNQIILNGLRAIEQLRDRNPRADLRDVRRNVADLRTRQDVDEVVRLEAKHVLLKLED